MSRSGHCNDRLINLRSKCALQLLFVFPLRNKCVLIHDCFDLFSLQTGVEHGVADGTAINDPRSIHTSVTGTGRAHAATGTTATGRIGMGRSFRNSYSGMLLQNYILLPQEEMFVRKYELNVYGDHRTEKIQME